MIIPGKKLVGWHQTIVDDIYNDDYLRALNKFASVDDVLGKDRDTIAKGEFNSIARIVMGTLGKEEYERHLAALLIVSAKAGTWQAVERVENQTNGLDVVKEKHFGHVIGYLTAQGTRRFLMPSAMYVTYCKEHKQQS